MYFEVMQAFYVHIPGMSAEWFERVPYMAVAHRRFEEMRRR